MGSDFAWLTEHSREICEKYAGKWIAVWNGEIIGVGDTATEAAAQADQEHQGEDYILEAIDSEPERI